MTDLLVKIKMFLEGQAAASQAAAAVREVGAASDQASTKGGALGGMFSAGMGRAAAFGAVLTGGVLIGVTAVTTALSKLKDGLEASFEAAAESEASALKLNTALANTGQFSAEASQAIQDLATEQQKLTNISDETWQESAAKLIQYGAAIEDIPQYTKIIEDLAGRLDGDVPRATQAFIGAMIGTRSELTRMGLDVDKNATKQEKLAAIMQVAATGAGQLRAATNTLGGGWASIVVQLGDVAENFGKLINTGGLLTGTLKAIASGIGAVNDLLGNSSDNTAGLVKNNEAAADLAGRMGEVKTAAGGAAGALTEAGDAAESAGKQAGGAADQFKALADAAGDARQAADDYADNALALQKNAIAANPLLDDDQKKAKTFEAEQSNADAKIKSAQDERKKLDADRKKAYDDAAAAQAKADEAQRNFDTAAPGLDSKVQVFDAAASAAKVDYNERRLLISRPDESNDPELKAAEKRVRDLEFQRDLYKKLRANLAKEAAGTADAATTAQAAKQTADTTLEPKINKAVTDERLAKSDKAAAAAKREAEVKAGNEKKAVADLEKRLKLEQTQHDTAISNLQAQGATDAQISARKIANLDREYALAKQIAQAKKEDTTQLTADHERDVASVQASLAGKAGSPDKTAAAQKAPATLDPARQKHYGTDGIEIGQGSKDDALYRPGSRLGPQAPTPNGRDGQDSAASAKEAADRAAKSADTIVKAFSAATTARAGADGQIVALLKQTLNAIGGLTRDLTAVKSRLDNTATD